MFMVIFKQEVSLSLCLSPHHLSVLLVRINIYQLNFNGFLSGTSGKTFTCQFCRSKEEHELDTWVGKIPWSVNWQLTAVFLPGKSHGQRSLESHIVHWVSEGQIRLSTPQLDFKCDK